VANAIQHGGGHFGVGLTRTPQGVRVMVGDSSPAPPTLGRPASLDLGGRGLRMVETVGRGWGHEVSGAGKVVWVELGGQPQRGDEAVSP
jgi:hypothetical protein